MDYTNAELVQCIRRELGFRRRVYAQKVAAKTMKQADADKQIGMMAAIEDLLVKRGAKNELPL